MTLCITFALWTVRRSNPGALAHALRAATLAAGLFVVSTVAMVIAEARQDPPTAASGAIAGDENVFLVGRADPQPNLRLLRTTAEAMFDRIEELPEPGG